MRCGVSSDYPTGIGLRRFFPQHLTVWRSPEAASLGTGKSTRHTSASPGHPNALSTFASRPFALTLTGEFTGGKPFSIAGNGWPGSTPGRVCPSPVHSLIDVSPFRAGLSAVTAVKSPWHTASISGRNVGDHPLTAEASTYSEAARTTRIGSWCSFMGKSFSVRIPRGAESPRSSLRRKQQGKT